MPAKYEYTFVRLGKPDWLFGKQLPNASEYQAAVNEHARDGWRLVQIFAPGMRMDGGAAFYELIFEREIVSPAASIPDGAFSEQPLPPLRQRNKRRNLEETWQHLGDEMPRDESGRPYIPSAVPNLHDEKRGFTIFQSELRGMDLSNSTLPRTFFGESGLEHVDFNNTDLTESRMCWNDFKNCDFHDADLTRCDMRASLFENCRFNGANLHGADLRRSSFEGCDFTNANLAGASADKEETIGLADKLKDHQTASMVWHEQAGTEPPGA
jgi:BTB/POZ domain-containing protein KCTD9